MKKIAFHNLGCKVNSYEMDVMLQSLTEKGYQTVSFEEKADIYIINTCTVTNIADRKSRQMLHRAKQKNPDAIVVAVGCYVQTDQEGVEKDSSIDLAIGNNRKKDLVNILEKFLAAKEENSRNKEKCSGECREENGGNEVDKTLGHSTICDMDTTYEYEEMTLSHTAEHTRAYIKIQDGCNQFCSYCVIPLARGRVRSRKMQDILHEISGLVEKGYKEVVLTGIHISSYGIDFDDEKWQMGESVPAYRSGERRDYSGKGKLIDLVEKVHEIPGLMRIRLGSLEPRIITESTARRLAALPKVCPHFHLSLQSGCDATLKRMNRHYTAKEYLQGVEELRKVFEHPAITTDVIVGFPGETPEEFAETKAFLEKVDFYEMHVFKFSKREGTVAAKMPGQLTEAVKTERSAELIALGEEQSKEFRQYYLGKKVDVLLEECRTYKDKNYYFGYTKDYVRVALEEEEGLEPNLCVEVLADEMLTDEIILGKR